MPDAHGVLLRMAQSQPHELAQTEWPNAVRSVRPEPGGAAAFRDLRRDGPVDGGAARIAPIQVGNDDFQLVERLVVVAFVHLSGRPSVTAPSTRMRASCRPAGEHALRRLRGGADAMLQIR